MVCLQLNFQYQNIMLHQQQELCFECTACGACCYGDSDSYIEATAKEIKIIRRYLGLSKKDFSNRYLSEYTDGTYGIRINTDGRCCLLDKNNQCSVYPVRPNQCQTYPFWPEILKNKHSWRAEQRRCEGINKGSPVNLTEIEEKLRSCLDPESCQ